MALVVIAHRGASGTRPENTLVAFRRAHELGAHMLELDVQLTRDREVVVMHDGTLHRTTNGRGDVATHTLGELRRLDAGRWFHPDFAGERVPTLSDVLDAVPLPVNVELKGCVDDGLERRALEVVERAGALDRVVFSSFDHESLVRLRRISKAADIAVLWHKARISSGLEVVRRVGATALHIRKDRVAPAGVRDALDQGVAIRAWTVNELEESNRLEALGVSAVFTDFPERFLQTDRP